MKQKLFTFLCLCILCIGSARATDYTLVTSTSDLVAGCKYVIGNAKDGDANFMATTSNANNRKVTSANVSNSEVTLTNDMLVLELGGVTGAWTLKTTNYKGTDGYLASAASGSNNYCRVISSATTAIISFNADAAVITLNPHTSRNKLSYNYNSGSPLFACYSSGQDAVYLFKEVKGKTLSSVEVSGNPSKTTYEIGEAFDPKGLVVTGTYSDGSTDATLASKATWNITPATFSSTTQNSVSATATVSGVSSTAYSVTGLTVKKHEATPGTYTINLNNDLYGISTGNNANEQSTVKNDITIISGCTSSATSKTYYDATHIRYYDNSYLKLAVPDGYKITRVQFNEPSSGKSWGGGFNVDYGTYNDTKSWSGSASSLKFSFTNQNRAASIIVTYEAIKTLTSIAVKTAPATTSYAEGESFDPTGLIITATYDDNSAEDIVYNNDTKDKFSFNPALDVELATTNTSVEITFGGKTCNQAITVEQIELVSVEVSGTLTKSEYVEGSDFDFAGLVATAKYSNGNERDVTEAATWTIDPAAITFGLTSVKVCATFNDVSGYKDCDITVTEAPKVITEWNTLFGKEYNGSISEIKADDVDWNGTTVFGVSVNVKNGTSTNAYLKDDEIRMYNGYTMTLTAPSGKVFTKIETTKGGKSFTSEAIAANVGKGRVEGSAYTWIGTTNELVITCSNSISITKMAFTLYDENATQDVTITDVGWATAYIPFASTVEGATAYYVTVDDGKAILNKIEGTIPAETGVVLKGEPGTATFTLSTNTPESVDGNLLVGTTEAGGKTFSAETGTTYYILSNGVNGVGFYYDNETHDNGATAKCDQYKAVLAVLTGAGTPSFFTFDDATAINGISSVKASGVRYNLNGQAVGEDYKGIVIVNGKKMFNK